VADEAGTVVAGRYRLVELLGQGGMGSVWLAHDETLDRNIAIKQVQFSSGLSDSARENLIKRAGQEARAAARLGHPGIVTVHDVVEHDGAPWIVMEYVPGPSLGSVISQEGRLSWQRAAEIGAQVAEALGHAHAAGVIHRDLKPDNILLAKDRSVITDFGIARINDTASRLTSTNHLVGTPQYMSPEQLEGKELTAASDLWSLGATLYAAVEGHPPFDSATLVAIITAVLTHPMPTPLNAGPLAGLLAALLSKDPQQRPDTATTARRLREITSQPATPTQPVTPTALVPAPDPGTQHLTKTFTPPRKPDYQPVRQQLSPRLRGLLLGILGLVVAAAVVIALVTELPPAGGQLSPNTSGSSAADQPTTTSSTPPPQQECAAIANAWNTFTSAWAASGNAHEQQFAAVNALFTQVNATIGQAGIGPQYFLVDLAELGQAVSNLDSAVVLNTSPVETAVSALNTAYAKVQHDCSQ
jgi:serine/threonine protein kinase